MIQYPNDHPHRGTAPHFAHWLIWQKQGPQSDVALEQHHSRSERVWTYHP